MGYDEEKEKKKTSGTENSTEELGNQPETTTNDIGSPTNNSSGYSFEEFKSVADTGSLPSVNTTEKDTYTKYMDEFRSIYDKKVEANNKSVANKVAAANAEYNELNRNVNEINKANGRANTGYAGDTSIAAYNAYRNALNEAYAQSEQSNNELYSYYMQQMLNLQQAKDSKEATDRQMSLQEKQFAYNQARDAKADNEIILGTISEKLEDEGALNANGTIKAEKAKEVWDYLVDYYGSSENIPKEIMATLNSTSGFKNWQDAVDNGTIEESYIQQNEYSGLNTLGKIDTKGQFTKSGEGVDFAVLDTQNTGSAAWHDDDYDNFSIIFNGETFSPEMGADSTVLSESLTNQIKEQIRVARGREAKDGDAVYYDGKIYVVTTAGTLRGIQNRSKVWAWNWGTKTADDLLSAVKSKLR